MFHVIELVAIPAVAVLEFMFPSLEHKWARVALAPIWVPAAIVASERGQP